jgi:hypothetical protein
MKEMKQLIFLIIIASCILACSDDDGTGGFTQDELSPVAMFTHNNTPINISNDNSGLWTSGKALNENGEEVQGKLTKGFGSVIDPNGNSRHQVTVLISKWVSEDEIDYVIPNIYLEVIRPETFKSIFTTGKRLYAKNAHPIYTTNEVVIEYFDENATHWSSSYQGNFYTTPSYKALQPSSSFTITRSMALGTDSVFVEAKFKARLYKNETEYFDVSDGYFKGMFYRKP